SPPGSPSTVKVTWIVATTQAPGQFPPPVACDNRFQVAFPDFGNDVSLDNNASLRSLGVAVDGVPAGLSPAFASGTTSYAATVPFRSQVVTITPIASTARIQSVTVAQDAGTPVSVASGSAFPLVLPAPGATSHVSVRVL